jgi:Pyruvate/2-oxoacid:ferredoxin oxidoreductase gamma subunit
VNCSERKERKGLHCLSAGKIALRHGLGSETNPIINTAMVGAVAGFFPELDFKNVEKGICESLAPSLWKKNIRSAGEAFESIQTIQNKETWSLSCV